MALSYTISYQGGSSPSAAVITRSIGPSFNGIIEGNDVIFTAYNDGSSIGNIRIFIRPSISYVKNRNGYGIVNEARIYTTQKASDTRLRFKVTNLSWGVASYYQNYSNQRDLPTSSTTLAKTETVYKYPLTQYNITLNFVLTVAYSNEITWNLNVTVPPIRLNFNSDKIKFTYRTNGKFSNGSNTYEVEARYGDTGETTSPGNPIPPSESLNRVINVTFDPKPSNESPIVSSASVLDSWNTGSWSPDIKNNYYNDQTFNYNFEKNYSESPVMIPAWNTSNYKPTRTGYTFKNWNWKNNNIGSEPNTQTFVSFGSDGGTLYYPNAIWEENKSVFKIYSKVKFNGSVIDVPDSSIIQFDLKYTEIKNISTINFNDYSNKGFSVIPSGIYPISDLEAKPENMITVIEGKSSTTEYYVLYSLINDSVTLKLNGGNINGNTSNVVINYNRFSEGISLRDDKYLPTKNNTTFVGWVYNNQYISEIIPSEQTTWPLNRVLVAEYIDLGMFIALKDRLNKLHWYPIINKWVFKNGNWRGEYSIPGTTIIHTSTSMWVLKDGSWHLEYGKTNLPLE